MSHATVYINVEESISADSLSLELGSINYNLESASELDILKAKLVDDFNATIALGLKRVYAIITVHENIDVKGLDTIMQSLEEDLSVSISSNILLAILGTSRSKDHYDEMLVSFIESGSRALQLSMVTLPCDN